jgi:putative transposase
MFEARVAGVDLGLTDYATVAYSDGTREKLANPRYLRATERRLARAQKSLSRKVRAGAETVRKHAPAWHDCTLTSLVNA